MLGMLGMHVQQARTSRTLCLGPTHNPRRDTIMRVFLTGASGFVGSAIVQDLLGAGREVLGLARSDASARQLVAAGAEAHPGSLEDLDSLKRGAAAADGVIHTAFLHDFTAMAAAGETDLRAIEAIAEALAGSGRPFVVTSGMGHCAQGR